MSEQELDEIVQITVEDFNQDEHSSKILDIFTIISCNLSFNVSLFSVCGLYI